MRWSRGAGIPAPLRDVYGIALIKDTDMSESHAEHIHRLLDAVQFTPGETVSSFRCTVEERSAEMSTGSPEVGELLPADLRLI